MRVSLEWLERFVDITIDPSELADLLSNSGTAVEGLESIGGGLEGYLVGNVLEIKYHPAADRLSICKVDIGHSVLEIICGAPNIKKGVKVPVALPGSRLPDGTTIKEVSIRGVNSRGMILSESELGISDEAKGIMILEEDHAAGTDLAEALGMPDTVLVLEVTPNRPDCLSMLGVAREVAALTGKKVKRQAFRLKEGKASTKQAIGVEIVDSDLCSRYAARVIENISIAISPWWMRRRLQAAGVRPINNVVDITNYVMLELGQPLHAFDYHRIEDGRIIVRRAADKESLTTLDGVSRELSSQDLLICDPSGPVALAGVMGGEMSEVGENTSAILLESAHFNAQNIMRTSRMQDLSSEASYRFERGVDPGGCVYAADRAAFLMQELAGGIVLAGVVDARGRDIEPAHLNLRVKRTGKLIGIPLSLKEADALLRSIEVSVEGVEKKKHEEILKVQVPTFRPDLEREIDLVEEVARLYGYHRIPPTLPVTSKNIGGLSRDQRLRRRIAWIMCGIGLQEAITQSFISPRWLDILDPTRDYLPGREHYLRNPISEETSVMRPTLLPGLLEALSFNINRRVTDVFLFEMGKVFLYQAGDKLPREPVKLGCAMVGNWIPKQRDRDAEEADFFTAKGVIEALAYNLHVRDWSVEETAIPFLHPASSCRLSLGGNEAGYLGTIHPRVAIQAELPQHTTLMEIDVERLIEAARDAIMYEEIPRFPSISVDVAVVVKENITAREVEETIREAGGELLRQVRLFDLYRGEQIGEDEKSLAFNLNFYALDRTLRDEEVRQAQEEIIKALADKLGARLR